jgi:flagellar basal body-associated protein FliL
VAFDKVGPFHIETEGYTYNASLAVQTTAGDARWLRRHHDTINETLYRTLLATHPQVLTTPAGLVALQQSMTQSVNRTLDQPRVQQVMFTDFVIQPD